ncbi:MAG: helix-turn-helix domain-containing protein [bacterium]|nr:helix-turn-helix domain-containing protein [bacterium]
MTDQRLTVTVTAAAELPGISRGMAYGCVRTGELPSVRLGGRILVPRQSLDELLGVGGNGARAA